MKFSDPMEMSELIDICRAEALAAKFYPRAITEWERFCREYSKTFHTRLQDTMLLPPEHVIYQVLCEQIGQYNLNNAEDVEYLIEQVRRIEDPDYDNTREKEMDQFVTGIEEWEEKRQKEGRKLPVPKKSPFRQSRPEEKKETPKQGFIDLSYLSREEES